MNSRGRESGVVFLILALLVAMAIVIFAFVRAYQAHQQAAPAPASTSFLYK